MHPIFVPPHNFHDDIVIINDVNYLKNVLRLKKGSSLLVVNGEGYKYEVIVNNIKKEYVEGKIINKYQVKDERETKVILFQSILKGKNMELVLQKVTELGIDEIIPIITERTIVRIDNEAEKIKRWNRIIEHATAQSRRAFKPQLSKILDFNSALTVATDYKLILYEQANVRLKDIINNISDATSIGIFIGPEGSFTPYEIELAKSHNCLFALLNRNILRAETCAIAAVSIIVTC